MIRRALMVGMFAVAALAVPRPSEAGLIELIWEMTGPRMLGVGLGCDYTLRLQPRDCKVHGLMRSTAPPEDSRGPFLFLGGAYFFSTGHDSDTLEYDWFRTHMLAFEPAIVVRSKVRSATNRLRINHSVGITGGLLFGERFRRFTKVGVTVTPIEFEYKRVAVGLKVRWYPDGFTDAEFSSGRQVPHGGPSEAIWGPTFSWIFWER